MTHLTIHLLPESEPPMPFYFVTMSPHYEQRPMRWEKGAMDYAQILFVVEGEGYLEHEGVRHPLSRGSAFFANRGIPSFYGGNGRFVTAFLTARGEALDGMLAHFACPDFFYLPSIDTEAYLARLSRILKEYEGRRREGVLSSLTYAFFTDFFEEAQAHRLSDLDRILLHIEKHFGGKLTLSDLAAVGGMSVSKLCHDFKRLYGMTVFGYILHVRLSYARSFLSTYPDATTREAAAAAGFEDVSYFCRAYRRKFEKTPAAEKRERRHALPDGKN